MAYREWGPLDSEKVVVCVHGLARNATDFDELASTLSGEGWRVVCPDVVGRGLSDWLEDASGYALPQYAADMAVLIGRIGVERLHWVGTSMGGLIGMILAAQKKSPIASLLLNDVGPLVPQAALAFIKSYVGESPLLPDIAAAEAFLRARYATFGPLDDEGWRRVAEGSVVAVEGAYRLAYDPAIAEPLEGQSDGDVDLWQIWDAIACPVLTLRGAESLVLLRETALEMKTRGPRAELVEIAGCGHAPWLKSAAEIEVVRDWLNRRSA